MSYRILPKARDDIAAISTYIRNENPRAAERWFSNLERRFEAIGAMPGMGSPRPEFGENVRLSVFGSYLILYREQPRIVDIVRVVHGRRDPSRWLDG
jgi:toxin ParE1/3/4